MSGTMCIIGGLINGQDYNGNGFCFVCGSAYQFPRAYQACRPSFLSCVFSVFTDWLHTRPMRLFTVASCVMALMTNSFSQFSPSSAFSVGLHLMKSVNLNSSPAVYFSVIFKWFSLFSHRVRRALYGLFVFFFSYGSYTWVWVNGCTCFPYKWNLKRSRSPTTANNSNSPVKYFFFSVIYIYIYQLAKAMGFKSPLACFYHIATP